jgi:transmembrane sensor
MDESIDILVLERYVAGQCTAAERVAVEQWLAAEPGRARELDLMRAAWELTARELPEVDSEIALARAKQRSRSASDAGIGAGASSVPIARAKHRRRAAPFVVGVLAAAGVGFVALLVGSPQRTPVGLREFATTVGQRETISLVDGTEVTLAPASRLRLGAGYDVTRREMSLDGEAYFVVAHDPDRPFVVHSANAVTEDIGTRFAIRAYHDEPLVRVVVADGAVGVRIADAPRAQRSILTRGGVERVDASGVAAVDTGADVAPYLAWTRGELVCVNARMGDALAQLARWYGLDITLAEPALAGGTLTATYWDEPVGDVLQSVATAMGASVRRTGRRVVFTRR